MECRLTPSGTTATVESSGKRSRIPAKRPVQHGAIVEPGADHDLAVHLDAVVEKTPQPTQAHRSPAVAKHAGADLGVGSVDRDVQRRQALVDDTFEVRLGEAGEGREVAIEERQPVVVVFYVQAPAHALWKLVDEAELAVVVTSADAIEDGGRDLEPERLTFLF